METDVLRPGSAGDRDVEFPRLSVRDGNGVVASASTREPSRASKRYTPGSSKGNPVPLKTESVPRSAVELERCYDPLARTRTRPAPPPARETGKHWRSRSSSCTPRRPHSRASNSAVVTARNVGIQPDAINESSRDSGRGDRRAVRGASTRRTGYTWTGPSRIRCAHTSVLAAAGRRPSCLVRGDRRRDPCGWFLPRGLPLVAVPGIRRTRARGSRHATRGTRCRISRSTRGSQHAGTPSAPDNLRMNEHDRRRLEGRS